MNLWYSTLTPEPIPTPDLENMNVSEAVTYFEKIIPFLMDKLLKFGKLVVFALITYVVGRKLIRFLIKFLRRSFERSSMETSVGSFLISVIRVTLNIILGITVAGVLGFEATSLVALVGSAGLTVGLALQGSLSNFAGGVLILIMHPFRTGDYIIANGKEGIVTEIDIFYTKLLTPDNQLIVLTNGSLANSDIINMTNETMRRLDLSVSIHYSEDIKKVKNILEIIARREELVLQEQEIMVFVSSFDPSAITIGLRVWVQTENYFITKWNMLENIKEAFDENNITIPYDQLDVNINQKW